MGGLISFLQAEAASLIHLHSLVLLDILQRWGRANFKQLLKDVEHFYVILSLSNELPKLNAQCNW
jgi:hypothetical protein